MSKIIRKISAVMLSVLTALTLCASSFDINAQNTTANMPDGFITSVKICKEIQNATCIEFGEEEIQQDADLNLYFKYSMPEGMLPNVEYSFELNGNYKESIPFSINSDDNVKTAAGYVDGNSVKLTFTQAANDAGLLTKGTTGVFWFGASFDESKISNTGKQKFEINAQGIEKSTDLNFAITPISANVNLVKDGTLDLDNKTIIWTIDVDPELLNASAERAKLNTLTITDVIPKKLTYVSASAGSDSASVEYNEENRTLTISYTDLLSSDNPKIIITTLFDPTDDGFLTNNKAIFKNQATAEFTYPQIKKDTNSSNPTYNQAIDDVAGSGTAVSNEKSVEITGSSLDKRGALLNGSTMTWTIKVQNSLGLTNTKIVDTLPSDTTLIDETLKLGGEPISADNTNKPYYKIEESILTIHLDESITSEQVITYQTEFNADWQEKHSDGKVVNTAEFYGGTGPGLLISKSASVPLGGQLLTKNGTYDASDHTISWKIDVKNTGDGLKDIVLTDIIPEGQSLVGDVNASDSTAVTVKEKTITITYEDAYNGWNETDCDIEYKTVLDDSLKHLWGNNATDSLSNTISISADGLPSQNLSVTANAPIVSKVLKKDFMNYDFTNKTVTWKLTVNENQMALKNAKIVDTLPTGWQFVEGSVKVTQNDAKINGYTKDFNNQIMTLNLPEMNIGDEPYIIAYQAKLTDEKQLATNQEILAENTSILTGDEIIDTGVSVTGRHKIAQSVLEKSGSNKDFNKAGYLSWEITVNRNLSEFSISNDQNVIVVDKLNEDLMPIMDSVKVYQLTLDVNGKEINRQELDANDYSVNYSAKDNTLSVDFMKKILLDAYAITFNTDVLESNNYSNTVYFKGLSDADLSATSQSIRAYFSGGNTGIAFGKVETEVVDDTKQDKLSGAEFAIYKKDSLIPLYTGLTIEDIVALSLRHGDYKLEITKVPAGYLMPTNPFQDFKISNYPISLTFELIKKADSSNGGTTGGGSTAKPDEEIVLPEQPEEIPTADNEHENQNDPVNDTEIKDENDNHGIPNGVPNTGDIKRSYLLLGSLSFGLLLLCIYINNKTRLEK